jgi:hypothetical protein
LLQNLYLVLEILDLLLLVLVSMLQASDFSTKLRQLVLSVPELIFEVKYLPVLANNCIVGLGKLLLLSQK